MFKLYAMNAFICIFVLHFVSNKERFYLIKKGGNENKYEITIDFNLAGGKDFYNKLKVNKTIDLKFTVSGESFLIYPTGSFTLEFDNSKSVQGNIIYHSGDIISGSDTFRIIKGDFNFYYTEIVAKVIQADQFKNEFRSIMGGPHDFQFLLEEEKEEKEEKEKQMEKPKSENWETVKMMEKIKSLKRYRIVKRLNYWKHRNN